MGLLDDAIREHLDLKRRRGADPAEVQRAEQEALGPVRRGPVEAEPPELVLDEEHKPAWEDEYTDEHEAPAVAEGGGAVSFAEPDAPLEPRAGLAAELFDDDNDDPFGDERPMDAEPPFAAGQSAPEPYPDTAEGPPAPPPHRAPLPSDQFGETVEYDVEEALDEPGQHAEPPAEAPPAQTPPAQAPGAPDEDPLEETPEFLQETPDHDRLWFEQRPPRDFDFDG